MNALGGTATLYKAVDKSTPATPGAAFREGRVEGDGFRIRYLEAGRGPVLVHLHGAGSCVCRQDTTC